MQDSPNPDLPRSNRRAGLIGGVVGSIGLAASIFALTATAGASGPVLQDTDSEPAPIVDEDFPDDEAWADFDACIDAVFESRGIDVEEAFGEFEGDFEDFEDFDFGPAVSIMDGDEMSFAEFGDGDGSITITKNGDDITVTSDGDVMVEEIDWDDVEIFEGEMFEGEFDMLDGFDDETFEELDEALSSCEDQLPEGVDLEHEFEAFELDGDLDDDDHLDDDEDADGEADDDELNESS